MNHSDDSFDLYSVSTKGNVRNRRKKIRRVVNIVASITLVLSILMTTFLGAGMVVLGSDMTTEIPILNWFISGLKSKMGENVLAEVKAEPEGMYEDLIVSANSNVSYILVVGVDLSESLTDIIVVACIDHQKKTLNFLQIPRDTYAGNDVPTGKINAVYGNPRKQEAKINALRRRISSLFGIPLDHYCLFTIDGFVKVVDALGGVSINVTQKKGISIMNPYTKKSERIGPGWVTLKGTQAVGFVRKRKGDGYVLGDIDRIKAQRLIYIALAKKLKSMTATQMYNIATKCYSEIATDMNINEILGYATEIQDVSMEKIGIYSVPGQFATKNKLSMWSPHKDEYVALFNKYFNPHGTPITESDIKMMELHTKKVNYDLGDGSMAEIEQEQNQK